MSSTAKAEAIYLLNKITERTRVRRNKSLIVAMQLSS